MLIYSLESYSSHNATKRANLIDGVDTNLDFSKFSM